jgi:hypothetical protein
LLGIEPAWFVPGPALPWLEGFAELGFVLAPVVVPAFMFDPVVVDDLWCFCVIACAVDIGLASPAITSAATAHLIFVMARSPSLDDAKYKSALLRTVPVPINLLTAPWRVVRFGT